MPFRSTNATAVFQTLDNDVLQGFINLFVFIYLAEIFIFSKSLQEHKTQVHLFLQRILENPLYEKGKICELHVEFVFLGIHCRKRATEDSLGES